MYNYLVTIVWNILSFGECSENYGVGRWYINLSSMWVYIRFSFLFLFIFICTFQQLCKYLWCFSPTYIPRILLWSFPLSIFHQFLHELLLWVLLIIQFPISTFSFAFKFYDFFVISKQSKQCWQFICNS